MDEAFKFRAILLGTPMTGQPLSGALGGLADGLPLALAYMGPGAGLAAIGALLTMVGVAIFMVVGFVWYPVQRLRAASRRRRGQTSSAATQEARYSPPDRFLHRMAFATVGVQKALADLEDRLYAGRIANIDIERPVFIASLPRAGTTLLLETLYSSAPFAAHTYRNMPFLFMPLLWNGISHRFRLAGGNVQRAHGDGLSIGYESTEAFEEALWRAFHPEQYLKDRILPWPEDDGFASAEFDAFIKNHMRKLIALHDVDGASEGKEPAQPTRYLSKNNGNLARLGEVARLFPDATVLVPLRRPLDHAASLLRMHARFDEIHAQEPFTRRYMQDIGHFDFGANLRPIDFDHWLDGSPAPASSANFWLAYWCAAFAHVLAVVAKSGGNVALVDYDDLCTQPTPHLERIAGKTGLEAAALAQAAARFRAPTRYDALDVDAALLERASALHGQLLTHCLD